jgi:hypothetical protein
MNVYARILIYINIYIKEVCIYPENKRRDRRQQQQQQQQPNSRHKPQLSTTQSGEGEREREKRRLYTHYFCVFLVISAVPRP